MSKTFLLAILLLSTCLASSEEAQLPAEEMFLKALGVPEAKQVPLLDAIEEAEAAGDIEPLKPFFSDPELPVVTVAAGIAFAVDSEGAREVSLRLLRAGQGNREALLLALCYSYDAETVDFLIGELQRDQAPNSPIVLVLRVLTQQNQESPAAWSNWWSKVREEFELSPPESLEEQTNQIMAVATSMKSEQVVKLFRSTKSGDPVDKMLGKVGDTIANLNDLRERGRSIKLSADAEEGDWFFSTSDWARAEEAYRKACRQDPRDFRSRFLLGCVLFERGHLKEAAEEFAYIVARKSRTSAARYMETLSRHRISHPEESVLQAALRVYRGMEPKPEMSMSGWPDPVIEMLVGQSMADKGIYHISDERLNELIALHPRDPEILVGTALARPPQQAPVYLAAALESCPDSPLAIAASYSIVSASANSSKLDKIRSLLDRLVKVDPDNKLVRLVQVYYRSYLSHEELKELGKENAVLGKEDVSLLLEAFEKPGFNSYSAAAAGAMTRVLELLKYPLRFQLANDRMRMISPTAKLGFDRLRPTVAAAFKAGQTEEAIRLCEGMVRVAGDIRAAKGPAWDRLAADAIAAVFGDFLEKHDRSVGEIARADRWQAQEKASREERNKAMKDTNLMCLFFLPVPSLQAEMIPLYMEDEVAFFRLGTE